MRFDVEIVEVRAVVETQADPVPGVQARRRAVPGELGDFRKWSNPESESPDQFQVLFERDVVVRRVVLVGGMEGVIGENGNGHAIVSAAACAAELRFPGRALCGDHPTRQRRSRR